MDSTFGAVYVGTMIATALYGVSCAQVFYYFQHYSEKDGFYTKAAVISSMVSDTLHQVFICHSLYHYLITSYNKPEELGYVVWSILAEVIPNAVTALIVQTFFAVRIWKFSQKNLPIAVALAVFIVAGFLVSVVYTAMGVPMRTFVEGGKIRPLSMTINVLAVAADVLITVVFCVLLHRSRTKLRSTDTMINLLIAFTVQTGMWTSLFAVGSLVSSSAFPNTFLYLGFYFSMGRLYCNSLLGTLNVRRVIRGRAHNDLGVSLRVIGESGGSSNGNRGEIHIKTETVQFIAGEKSRGCDGSSVFAQANTDGPHVVEGEYEPESARGEYPKGVASDPHLESDPTKSKDSSNTTIV